MLVAVTWWMVYPMRLSLGLCRVSLVVYACPGGWVVLWAVYSIFCVDLPRKAAPGSSLLELPCVAGPQPSTEGMSRLLLGLQIQGCFASLSLNIPALPAFTREQQLAGPQQEAWPSP